jgi:hypothetical protein
VSGRTRGRSCGSPTRAGCATPRSPPTPAPEGPDVSSPTSNYATAAAPRAEDRIRAAKDTGLTNLPCTSSTRTGSGARSWRLHRTSGAAVGAETAPAAAVLHPGPDRPPRPPGPCCTCRRVHPGQGCYATASPDSVYSPSPAEHHPTTPTTQEPRPPVDPAPTRATSAELSHPAGRIAPRTPAQHRCRSRQRLRAKDPG